MTWLAWLAPGLCGLGLWLMVRGFPRRHAAWCAALGGGWLLGALLTGMLPGVFDGMVSPQSSVRVLAPWLLLGGIAMIVAAWRWRRLEAPAADPPLELRWRMLLGVALLLLACRFAWMWREATLPPLFPWDAWTAWSVKPATWFQLDRWVTFDAYGAWLASGDPGVFTSEAVGYPGWMGRLQVWYAAGAGCWCDPAFTRLWPALWLAMLLVVYGLLRGLGVRVATAVIATCALGSLPLLDVHAAMAGYADLWLAAFLVVGMLLWLDWYRRRTHPSGVLALLLILSLRAVKLEGGVWMLLALATMALGLLPSRLRVHAVLAAALFAVVLAVGVFAAGWHLLVPGLGTIFVDGHGLHVPGLRAMRIGWHPVADSALKSLFVVSNWHLLFFVAFPWIALRWRHAREGTGLLGMTLLGALLFLFVLFFFTEAAVWADNFTSIGRLLLHVVPLLVCYLALLDHDEPEARREA